MTSSKARFRKQIQCRWITGYLRMIEKGTVVACKEQHALAAYVRNVFATEKLVIDTERLNKYATYQKYFPFELFEWEKFLFALFMCVFREDGTPRWPTLFALLGRGSGKNGFLSFVAFCATTETNSIPRYNVDICATSDEQAKTSFMEIHDDVLEDPQQTSKMRKNFSWNLDCIKNLKTGSEIKHRTDNPSSKDGLRSGMVAFDEVHAYQNWKNINVFTTGLGKKPHPRRLYITSDGNVNDGPLDKLKARAAKILFDGAPDNGFLPFVCKLDCEEDVHDEANWPKANPSLPYLPNLLAEIRVEYQEYIEDPVNCSEFMTKRMNIRIGKRDIEVTSWDNLILASRELPDLAGMPCVMGIDASLNTDFTSASLVFRVDGEFYSMNHSWLCAQSPHRAAIKPPLEQWERDGLISLVDDVEVPPEVVIDWMLARMELYDIKAVALDSYRFSIFKPELAAIGFTVKGKTVTLLRPSHIMQAQPKVTSTFARHHIAWGEDPAMRWFTNNTKLVPAANDNYLFGKIDPKARKTDGFMALVAAMCIEDMIPECGSFEALEPIYL